MYAWNMWNIVNPTKIWYEIEYGYKKTQYSMIVCEKNILHMTKFMVLGGS